MSVQSALKPGGLRNRFALIFTFLALLHNPTRFSLLELVRTESVLLSLRVSVGLVALLILAVLIRQTWTGLRPLGSTAVMSLALAMASLLWFLRDWIVLNELTRYLTQLLVYTGALTFGQVIAFYIRQCSGQRMILRNPP